MTLGSRMQKLRKENKLTQQELSKKINISHPQLVRYENKDVQPPADVLKKIAETTDGAYFRATDNHKLREIYQQIDELEKTRMDVKQFSKRKEEYFPFLLAAMLFLLFEIMLRYTIFRTIP